MEFYFVKKRWKLLLLVSAFLISFASIFITNSLVQELSNEERKKIELWAEAIRELSQATSYADTNHNFNIIFEVLQNNTTVPVILADDMDNILSHRNIPEQKLKTQEERNRTISQMKASKEPIEVKLLDNSKNFIYYKDSSTLVKLTYYPYIQITIILLFILVSYLAFSKSRNLEQNRVWVGMAKETAHQLGTPTSSLLAWQEIIKDSGLKPELVAEFEKDVSRLEKVVDRFSKIGSAPTLTSVNIIQLVNSIIGYLEKRISKKIEIVKNYNPNGIILLFINETLLEWVIENIIKNGIDAMHINGTIGVSIKAGEKYVTIDISDTGKGIPRSQFKSIFQPGFTTKARGWGLGLTLSKRIVEEYHNGKIFVNSSEIDKGSSFRIVLNKKA